MEARPQSVAEKEKEESIETEQLQRQSTLLPLPQLGSQERLFAERELVRKLDTRILPIVLVIYILNYIDVRSLACLSFTSVKTENSASVMALLRPVCKAWRETYTLQAS